MMVMMMAITPSVKASSRALPMGPSPLADEHEPLVLGEHVHAGFARLVELAPGAWPGDEVIGLLRHRARYLGAEPFGHGLGLIAGHLLERAGEYHGLAGDRGIAARLLGVADANLRGETFDAAKVVWFAEIIAQALDHGVADLIERIHFLLRFFVALSELAAGSVESLPRSVPAGQCRCRRF